MNSIKNYLPKKDRKTILLLSDDMRLPSGVGTMSKEFILGTCCHFNWMQVGGAIKHPEEGKIIDMSTEINKITGITDSDVKIIPASGYGNVELIRQIITNNKIDAIMLFTDPRFFIWLFQMEHEIRQQIPIVYLNIWDSTPLPMYNATYYKSCDALFAISKQTYNINKHVVGEEYIKEI